MNPVIEKKIPVMATSAIRRAFLDFFEKKQHQIVQSSSLVPDNDSTLLFTNAGMVQFKDVFLGKDQRSYTRAASVQRCVRAGGKHNDLDRVGYTARHHTFFEMLGNFSFGDYFKREAIQYAWTFLTEVLQLPKNKLWITVYEEDTEAEDIWLNEIKIDATQFSRCGKDDNFWSMGPVGPCGPCSEIFYDHGPSIPGGPPGSVDQEGDRYIEIWNLVFMQYDRNEAGELTPLPKPSVDTGMGLERIAAVLQGVHSNYEIDLFQHLIKDAAKILQVDNLNHPSLRVIADHIRSCTFLMGDGVLPSNEGRGYVLRRIIRRAIRHGYRLKEENNKKIQTDDPFFYQLINAVIQEMSADTPKLIKMQAFIKQALRMEEEQFNLTLKQGLTVFERAISNISNHIIPGELVFRLYDTYGFPADLTADMARERDLMIDEIGFEREMEAQRHRSRAASQFKAPYQGRLDITDKTEFTGYENLLEEKTKITAIYKEGKSVDTLNAGEKGIIILQHTPFYAESGGQIGDTGFLRSHRWLSDNVQFQVTDTTKEKKAVLHHGEMIAGTFKSGDTLTAEVNADRRAKIVSNHTATHLLHHALQIVLGAHALQKGSLVAPDKLRFDFAHPAPLTKEELKKIEDIVNADIQANYSAHIKIMSMEEATRQGAIGLFENKYEETVRVVTFGNSVELCGGTHTECTRDIGLFKIISESGIASGIRRIEALTGQAVSVWEHEQQREQLEKTKREAERQQQLKREKENIKLATQISHTLVNHKKLIAGINVLACQCDGDIKSMRVTLDELKNTLKSAVIVLASVDHQKISFIAGVTSDLTNRIQAGELVNDVAKQVGGQGGGRADMAQAGGNQPEHLEKALESVYEWVKMKCGANGENLSASSS